MLINAANVFNLAVMGFVLAVFLMVVFLFWKSTSHTEEKTPSIVNVIGFMSLFLALAAISVYSSPMVSKIATSMNALTLGFMGMITLFAAYFHCNYSHTVAHKAPAVLTTLGILGTFLGIAIGLTDFDINDIQKSIPTLIDGMKTAFWASACGIFWAITIKLRDVMTSSHKKAVSRLHPAATVNDLVSQLTSLLVQAKMAHRDNNEKLDNLNALLKEFAEQNTRRLAFSENPAVRLHMVG